MPDLTDEEIACWLSVELAPALVEALTELQRRRSAQRAGAARIAEVVRAVVKAVNFGAYSYYELGSGSDRLADAIAARVAEQLAAAVSDPPSSMPLAPSGGIPTTTARIMALVRAVAWQPSRLSAATYAVLVWAARGALNIARIKADGEVDEASALGILRSALNSQALSAEERRTLQQLRNEAERQRILWTGWPREAVCTEQVALFDRLLEVGP